MSVLPDLSGIERNAESIVRGTGPEAVAIYSFLCNQFAGGSVTENHVFQFVYRSFYRLDNAGLTPGFKLKYFTLMERSRDLPDVPLRRLAEELHAILNRKNQQNLQFSFVTKLANTVNSKCPVYDSEIARVFGFHVPRITKLLIVSWISTWPFTTSYA